MNDMTGSCLRLAKWVCFGTSLLSACHLLHTQSAMSSATHMTSFMSSVTHMISYVICYTYDQLHVIYTQISFMSSATDMTSFMSSATHDQLCHLLHTWPASCHLLHTRPATPNIITTGDGVESFHSCTCIILEQKTGFLQMGFSTYRLYGHRHWKLFKGTRRTYRHRVEWVNSLQIKILIYQDHRKVKYNKYGWGKNMAILWWCFWICKKYKPVET